MPLTNKKITECTELTTAPAADDVYPLVDISDTTDDPTGTSKRQTWLNLIKFVFGSRFAADAGANDTYVATLVPAPAAYETGQHYRFKANTANTGACTVNFNSLGAKAIKKAAGGITTDLDDNDIHAGQWVDVVYDGTNMQMQSLLGNVSSGGAPGGSAGGDLAGTYPNPTVAGTAAALSPATVTLTDGATITWATAGARQNNARVTLGGNRTLDITGAADGATGLLIVIQDGTGGRTLTLPGGSKVINGGAGAVTLSTGAGDIDILTWYYDGTNFFWTIGTDYS